MIQTLQLPLLADADIVVVGGGPSGFAAALAAARQGSKVLVLEQSTMFGGLGTAGMHDDPVLGEQVERAAAHASGNDDLHALLLEPARQEAGLVRRRGDEGLTGDFTYGLVDIDDGELLAVSEMGAQAAGRERYGDLHG